MKKIVFGITSLTIGGAERVLIDLANRLCEDYDITILTIYAKGELEKQLSPKVKKKSLYPFSYQEIPKRKQKLLSLQIFFLKHWIYHKKIRENYDVEVAFLEGPITRLLSVKNKKVKKIAWVHNDIGLVFGEGWKSVLKKYYDRKIYSQYDTLVFVSRDNRKSFEKIYPDLRNDELMHVPMRVIYNYINQEKIIQKAQEEINISFQKPNFVEVARLTKQKAIDRLIQIHSKLIQQGYYHHFYIIGDGPEKEEIEKKINYYKVGKTFHLMGQQENPYPYMKQADTMVLLSYYEGYPMVVEESKILKKEILITDTAAREVVQDYPNAIIVENTEEGIEKGLKEKLKKNRTENNQEYIYNNEKIIEKVIKVLGDKK